MEQKLKKLHPYHFIKFSCLCLILLLLFLILYPTTHTVHADTETSASARVGVRSTTAISLYLESNSANINISPIQTGNFDLTSLKLGVRTNSESGYHIIMSTASNTNALMNTDQSKNYQISSITSDSTKANFSNNTWGYALTEQTVNDSTVYKTIPSSSGSEIGSKSTSTPGNQDEYHLTFGVKIDDTLPAGDYTNTVIVSVVANPAEISTLDQMVYMQDMTPTACANTAVATQRQLYDLRDGKKYWVERMEDGHCWMVQNLAFDLEGGKTLTADLTDLINTETKQWTVPEDRSTEREIPSDLITDVEDVRSWNLGSYLLTNPSTITGQCANIQNIADITTKCPLYINVEGWTDNYSIASATSNTYEPYSHAYNSHYLLGNYYQFGATTAGTSLGLQGNPNSATDASKLVNAPGSICPKGWQLPSSGQNLTALEPFKGIPGSFYELYSKYGYSTSKYTTWENKILLSLGDISKLVWAPMYFIRSGQIRKEGLVNLGDDGSYWSSSIAPDGLANRLILSLDSDTDKTLFPAYNTTRGTGVSVRCVSR